MPASNNKDTIYVDIDDEITTLIEKVKNSDQRIVALVLPKRASVLQSIVNMKLLKRSADQAKKHIVLITSEAGLLPLAGAVGFYVAKNLQTKPEIPGVPGEAADIVDDTAEDEPIEFNAESASDKPVGELAAAAGAPLAAGKADDAIETLQLDDDTSEETDAAAASAAAGAATAAATHKQKKNRKLAVPNFNRFRVLLVLGALLLILIIVGLYLAAVVLPKGTITISTDTNDVNSHLSLTADTSAQSLDPQNMIVPAQVVQDQKNNSQQVPTTGKKNLGDKATGNVSMSTSDCSGKAPTIPAGTGVSSNGMTYITQQDASLTPKLDGNFNCYYTASGVPITAQSAGSSYNATLKNAAVADSDYPG
ncbi:MAG TPA: hypothetical protein VFH39_02315, partial [Candidatus Saccharimonadales bacterium]|nr:hypothetical protein [Candidatus Saccharimonadales bacterium]